MNETTKLHLKKPEPEDFYDVGDFNGNADIIDGAISKLQKGKAEANSKSRRIRHRIQCRAA